MTLGFPPSLFPTLETPRLLLRETTLQDTDAVFELFANPAVTRFHDVATFTDPAMARRLIERRAQRYELGYGVRWAIALKPDRRLVGSCGLTWNQVSQEAEVGYELHPSHWRQGIMTEALGAVLRFGFERKGLHQVKAQVMPDNTASKRVLEKLGFQHRGVLRDAGFWNGRFHDLDQFILTHAHPLYHSSPSSER